MGIVPCYLGGECFKKRIEIFNYYRPIELDYSLEEKKKQELMREWASKSFTLLSEYINENVINNALINANLYLRDGVKEFFEEMNKKNIPIIVMSSGVGNIVKEYLKKEKCLLDNVIVISNFFEFKSKNAYINLEELMATSNKEYNRIPEDIRKKLENKKCLLFGDLVEDIKMGNPQKKEETLTFGFLEENLEKNIEKYNSNFDIVLTNNSNFNDVKNILNNT